MKRKKNLLNNVLNCIASILIISLGFTSCTTQNQLSQSSSYKNDYFALLNNSQKLKLENQKLTHRNKVLKSNSLYKIVEWYKDQQENSLDSLSLTYDIFYNLLKQNGKLTDKYYKDAIETIGIENIDIYKTNNNIIFTLAKEDIFIGNSKELSKSGINIVKKIEKLATNAGDTNIEIINYADNKASQNSIYYTDAFDLANQQNDKVRRSFTKSGSLYFHDIYTRICAIESSRKNNIEIVLKVMNNTYNQNITLAE